MARRGRTILAAALIVAVIFVLSLVTNSGTDPVEPTPRMPQLEPDPEAVAAAVAPPKKAPQDSSSGPRYIFAFGDSYTMYGFESEGSVPTTQHSLGNRVTKESRPDSPMTYTPKWLDYVIESSPPQTFAYNFARGASTVDADIVPPNFYGAKAFASQAEEFTATVSDEQHKMHAGWTAENSAFVVWFGINDVANTADNDENHNTLHRRVIDSYMSVINSWYDAGARRFVLLGVPPLERTPALLARDIYARSRIVLTSMIFNGILINATNYWEAEHPSASIKFLDTRPTYNTLLDNDPVHATCLTEEQRSCMWVDVFHPSVQLQRGVGEEIERALRQSDFWN